MARRFLIVFAMLFALTSSATTRYVTDRAAAPVKWMEWGKPAFERARREKRPLFVSIGFAASWDCQRMHREAFLNGENAEALNAYFVPVLLDRIEYPDAAEKYEGDGGWPANVILTPELEPIDRAYFMTTDELSRMLVINANRWADERPSGNPLPRAQGRGQGEGALSIDALRALAVSPRRDHLGGGFYRCDTCYEKMLNEQALYALAYLDAWQTTRDPDFAHVARTTLDYVLRDLVPPQGLFQSAQDGHSLVPGQGPEFVEGAFYRWTKDEIVRLIGNEAAGKILSVYDLEHGLTLRDPRFFRETYNELAAPLQLLLDVRQKRPAPFREIGMTGWNGLMISALARGAVVLDEPKYLDAATSDATIIATRLWDAKKKTLYRNETKTAAIAEDYAMLVQGLLDLFDSGHDVKWLELAIALQQQHDVGARNAMRLAALMGREAWPVVVVIGEARAPETREVLRAIYDRYEPNRSVVLVPRKGAARDRIVKNLPYVDALAADPERTVTYVCQSGACVKQ